VELIAAGSGNCILLVRKEEFLCQPMRPKRKKAGITGGAGYIASHIVADLLERDIEVIVLDNFSTGNRRNLFDHPLYHLIEGDVRDRNALEAFLAHRPDVVFHFAASKAAGESMVNPVKYSDNNLRGTLFLIEGLVQAEVSSFVFSSSAAVYGDPRYTPLDENHPRNPSNFYGYTKMVIEDTLEWYSRLTGLRYASLRYFNAAGYDLKGRVRGLENQPQNLLPIIMEVAAGIRSELEIYGDDYNTPDGTCIRDYIHVNDLAAAHIMAMDYLLNQRENITVNLGSEKGLSVKEVVEHARRITGRPIPARVVGRRPGDPAALYASSAKAARLLGWHAKVSDAASLIESMWSVYREIRP
jgi:UDP-glucose 4-epimerase